MTASMHRGAFAPISRVCRAVTLSKQCLENIQHGLFARFRERAPGDGLSVPQQLFGFGQFFHAAILPRLGFSGIPFHLSRVEAT